MNEDEPESNLWLTPLVSEDDFSVAFRGDHVHVELGPDFKVEAGEQDLFWARLKAICMEHNSKRVLIEGFVPRGERETSEVVEAGQRTATVPNLWLAFHLLNFRPTEQSELYVAIAATRGVRVKFFADHEHALNWLRRNAPP